MRQTSKLPLLHPVGEEWNHELFAEIRRRVFTEVFGPNGE